MCRKQRQGAMRHAADVLFFQLGVVRDSCAMRFQNNPKEEETQ